MNNPGIPGGVGGGLEGGASTAGMGDQEAAMVKAVSTIAMLGSGNGR